MGNAPHPQPFSHLLASLGALRGEKGEPRFPSPVGEGSGVRVGGAHENQDKLNHVLLSPSAHAADPAATLAAKSTRHLRRELRHPQTPAEQKLWSCLRNRQLNGLKFPRQHPIERFIIDFYCDEAKLCIEVDGASHAEQIEYDQARTAYLNELGHTVIRFTNCEVFNQCEAVLHNIAEECGRIVEDAVV